MAMPIIFAGSFAKLLLVRKVVVSIVVTVELVVVEVVVLSVEVRSVVAAVLVAFVVVSLTFGVVIPGGRGGVGSVVVVIDA